MAVEVAAKENFLRIFFPCVEKSKFIFRCGFTPISSERPTTLANSHNNQSLRESLCVCVFLLHSWKKNVGMNERTNDWASKQTTKVNATKIKWKIERNVSKIPSTDSSVYCCVLFNWFDMVTYGYFSLPFVFQIVYCPGIKCLDVLSYNLFAGGF